MEFPDFGEEEKDEEAIVLAIDDEDVAVLKLCLKMTGIKGNR
jgi:hypothetical protein